MSWSEVTYEGMQEPLPPPPAAAAPPGALQGPGQS
jgi:hypothetical protein